MSLSRRSLNDTVGLWILSFIYVLPVFIALNHNLRSIVSYAVFLGLALLMLFTDMLYLAFPSIIMFSYILTVAGNTNLAHVFFLLVIIEIVMKRKAMKFQFNQLIFIAIIAIYMIAAVFLLDERTAIRLSILNAGVIIYCAVYMIDKNKKINCLHWYVFAVAAASIYGFLNQNIHPQSILVNGKWVSYTRFLGAFEDMNYWGFFCNIAIAIVLFSDRLSRWMKVVLLLLLYYTLLATTSVTAYLCNLAIIVFFLIIKKMNFNVSIGIFVGIAVVVGVLFYASKNDMGFLTDAANRIMAKYETSDSMESFTTNRTILWKMYLDYFLDQDWIHQLFGTAVSIPAMISIRHIIPSVPHQEHITWLTNIGTVGVLCMEGILISKIVSRISRVVYNSQGDILPNIELAIIFIWTFYSFGLTMFTDFRFYFFFGL